MPIWTGETYNPHAMSRLIPMLTAAALGNTPTTVEIDRRLNWTLTSTERSETLYGRWMVLAWRSHPGQAGYEASVSLKIDGTIRLSSPALIQNQYIVGPSVEREEPRVPPAIPRFAIAENEVTFTGRATVGGTFETEFLAVRLSY